MLKKKKVAPKAADGWYKGYDISWLRKETEHPDHHLVAEYEAKGGK